MTRFGSSTVTALALVAMPQAPASAQVRLDVQPLIALYAPLASFQPAPFYSMALPHSPGDLSGVAWGAQGRIWLTPRFGVQLEVATAASRVGGGASPAGYIASNRASVLTASAQAVYTLSSIRPHHLRFWLSAGTGLIRHGGAAYAPYGDPVQMATAFGFGSAIPLSGHLSAQLGVTTLLYSIDVSDQSGTSLEHGFQVDPLVHTGLSWSWP